MYPQQLSHGNVLTFTPPGFNQTLNVKFPDCRLAVCKSAKYESTVAECFVVDKVEEQEHVVVVFPSLDCIPSHSRHRVVTHVRFCCVSFEPYRSVVLCFGLFFYRRKVQEELQDQGHVSCP